MKSAKVLFLIALLLASAGTAQAQSRVPSEGMIAVGGDAGFFVAREAFDTGATLAGSAEYWVTPRLSVRGQVGWAQNRYESNLNLYQQQVRLIGSAIYNWESGVWHPYVGGGIGGYFLRARQSGRSIGDFQTKWGLNMGIGVEYFSRRTITLRGEVFYHWIRHDAIAIDPSGATFTIGMKKYF